MVSLREGVKRREGKGTEGTGQGGEGEREGKVERREGKGKAQVFFGFKHFRIRMHT